MAAVGRRWTVSVLVVTDSAATIPTDLVGDLGISVVPLQVIIEEEPHLDGEIPAEELLEYERVTTAGPTPGQFLEVLERHGTADGTVVLTVSAELGSGTMRAAQAAAARQQRPVRVIDTATAAGAQGLVVLAAAAAAARGGNIDEVSAKARLVIDRVRLVACLPNLDRLSRSGHVPEAAAWASRMVGLRPIIELRQGKVHPLRPALGDAPAADHMLELWRRSKPPRVGKLHVAALHAMAPAKAHRLLRTIRNEVTPSTAFVGSFSIGMIVHSGTGLSGIAWWWEDASG